MNTQSESEIVTLLKKQLKEKGLNPDCVKEFYFADQNEVETLKADIKKLVKDKCRFFTKEEDGTIHVIAFINIDIKKFDQASVKGFTDTTNGSISNLFTKSKSLSKMAFFGSGFNPANMEIPAKKNDQNSNSKPKTK